MSESRLAAIDALCDILDRLPGEETYNAVMWACMAVGKSPDPTGLQPKPHRTLKQLYWDVTTDDLKEHLCHLVDDYGIAQEVLVKGLIAHLESWYEMHADPESVERAADNSVDKINELNEVLKTPVDDRPIPIPDSELKDLISKMQDMIDNRESRRAKAESTLNFIRAECERVFTPDFWQSQRFGFEE